ncbi:MAG: LPS export ABC transporter periplasmic protein LptC, partial [Cyanobacteriota bacterium]|nr:LPS export ABC transporter periplasmic protein LptC [Cyanobacteriota bacterium]
MLRLPPLAVLLLLTLGACQAPDPLVKPSPTNSPELKSQLTLTNATLEQANAQGQPLWKIQVQSAQYTPDRKQARLKTIRGDLYQDGKVVLKVKADRGEIRDNGAEILLSQNIVALDPRNQAVLYSQEVVWRPQAGILTARQNFRGEHPELVVTATEGRYETGPQFLHLTGQVQADAAEKKLRLTSEALRWEIPNHLLIGAQPLKLVRYSGAEITDQIEAPQARVHLKNRQVFLPNPNQFKSLQPPLQITAQNLTWFYDEKERRLETFSPLTILDYQEEITITGNQGRVDFAQNQVWLTGSTQALSAKNQSRLFADVLMWNIPDRTLDASGNILYE